MFPRVPAGCSYINTASVSKWPKLGGSVRSTEDFILVLTLDFITTTIKTTTGVFSVRTDGWLEATDPLACGRVRIGENQFLKNTPFEPLTSGLVAIKCIICFLYLFSAFHTSKIMVCFRERTILLLMWLARCMALQSYQKVTQAISSWQLFINPQSCISIYSYMRGKWLSMCTHAIWMLACACMGGILAFLLEVNLYD